MSNETKGNDWVTLVPDLFYDLIARIPAGAIVVLFSTWIIVAPTPTEINIEAIVKLSWAPATILLILLLVFAYATGIFLTAFGDLL